MHPKDTESYLQNDSVDHDQTTSGIGNSLIWVYTASPYLCLKTEDH